MDENSDIIASEAIAANRPSIRINGELNATLNESLIDLFVEETTQGLYRCEARFSNWRTTRRTAGFQFFGAETVDFGRDFTVEIGAQDSAQQIFNGRIMGIEAQYPAGRAPEIVILAEDRFQDLRMTRRTRTFIEKSISGIVREIADAHGLEPEIELVDSHPVQAMTAQFNRSDLAFLRDLAREIDAETWVDGETLHLAARTARSAGTVQVAYGRNLHNFTVLADLAHQRSSVSVSGWDVAYKEPINASAGEESISAELNGLRSGAEVLQQALGARHEQISHTGPADQEAAETTARYEFRQRARRFVSGSGTADGQPQMRAGSHVELAGLGSYFDGIYYARLVRHVYDLVGGYRTIFEAERPGIGKPS